jgi:hypothetical protein
MVVLGLLDVAVLRLVVILVVVEKAVLDGHKMLELEVVVVVVVVVVAAGSLD